MSDIGKDIVIPAQGLKDATINNLLESLAIKDKTIGILQEQLRAAVAKINSEVKK